MRIDNTGFANIKVLQNEGLGYGVDSVLLAAFAAGETGARPIAKNSVVADLGSGSGIVGFIICHKVEGATVVGIEKRLSAVDRARQAAELNDMTDRIQFVKADVKDYVTNADGTEHAGLVKFDAVVSNPPYFRQDAAIPSEEDDKYVARHETTANIYDFGKTMSEMLDRGGDCYLVHRPDRLVDIFEAMRSNGIEPKEMQMVVPRAGEPANIVLIHGVKGAGRELKLLPEIAVHTADGGYTELIERIYERDK